MLINSNYHRMTDNFRFEDPFQSFDGMDEFLPFWRMVEMFDPCEFRIHQQYHGPNEIVLHQTGHFTFKSLPFISIPIEMRSHVLLEPPTKQGGPQKIYR